MVSHFNIAALFLARLKFNHCLFTNEKNMRKIRLLRNNIFIIIRIIRSKGKKIDAYTSTLELSSIGI